MFKFQIFAGLHTAAGDCSQTTVQQNRNALQWAADTYLPGYTWQDCIGRWNHKNEASVVITFIGSQDEEDSVRMVAGMYKELASQESVMITKQKIDADFV